MPSSGWTNSLKFMLGKVGLLAGIEKQPEAILVLEYSGPAVRTLIK